MILNHKKNYSNYKGDKTQTPIRYSASKGNTNVWVNITRNDNKNTNRDRSNNSFTNNNRGNTQSDRIAEDNLQAAEGK